MLGVIIGEASKGYKKKNQRQKYQKQWINKDYWRGFIMTADFNLAWILSFMYILRQCQRSTILQLQNIVDNYKKISTPVPVPKHCRGFSFIHSGDYELDMNCDKTMFCDWYWIWP